MFKTYSFATWVREGWDMELSLEQAEMLDAETLTTSEIMDGVKAEMGGSSGWDASYILFQLLNGHKSLAEVRQSFMVAADRARGRTVPQGCYGHNRRWL
jgi:hypothetical protein